MGRNTINRSVKMSKLAVINLTLQDILGMYNNQNLGAG